MDDPGRRMYEGAAVSEFRKVGKLHEFREGRGRAVVVDGVKVSVFRDRGRLHAVRDRCPHMGASLAEGSLVEGKVRCSWHGWEFDLETGRRDRKDWAGVPVYDVRIDGDEVWIRAPEAPDELPERDDGDEWFVLDS